MVTDVVDGDSLEAALRDYGPAAIEDLLPRLRVIAAALDEAHGAAEVHGSLHPQNIFVSAEATYVAGLGSARGAAIDQAARPPYAAPEVVAGDAPVPASDQFALAAITYEWLFGRRVSGPAERPVDVRTLPGVDRDAMSAAFTRALAPQPDNRFASCTAFCDAISASVIPVLPLGESAVDDVLDTAFLPESMPPDIDDAVAPADEAPFSDLPVDDPQFDRFEPTISAPVEPVTSWQPSAAYAPPRQAQRFSGAMLIVSCLVGMVVGFAAGYMARPRALQTGPVQTMTGAGEAGRAGGAGEVSQAGTDAELASAAPAQPAPLAQPAPPVSPARPASPAPVGRLLVRSTPSGATVEVDGIARGVTPLALRDLELGSRTITVTRPGFIADERRVVLTRARPSRSFDVRLATAAAASAAVPNPAGPRAGVGGPAATTGSLLVESRPAGAAVSVGGQPRGVTPLIIEGLAPGDHRVGLSLAGYQSFATTVRVVAGERTRAAASLSVQE